MTSIISSHGLAMATAMAVAFSGSLILIAYKFQKSIISSPSLQFQVNPAPNLRPCLSSGDKKNKKKKRVRFAKEVMDTRGDSEEFRRQHNQRFVSTKSENEKKGMPPNRVALYHALLRQRDIYRSSCAY